MDVTGSVMVDNGTDVSVPEGAGSSPTPPPPRPPAPRRSTAMWIIVVALLAVALLTVLQGAQEGARGLAVILIGAGVARLVFPEPGLVGIVVRSRTIDATMYFGLAAILTILAQTAPNI